MNILNFNSNFTIVRLLSAIFLCFAVSACTKQPTTLGFNDPYEADNRKVHQFNKAVDKAVLRPAGNVYGAVFNETDDLIINNFVENLATPKKAINNLLQLDLENFVGNSFRFLINSTVGFGGINDVASDMSIPITETDFGQTLDKWGFGEGKYVELPFFGGSTERDAVGIAVDLFLDPLGSVVSSEARNGILGAKAIELAGDRHTYADLIGGLLYESADSYAAQRNAYLQNRRFFLTGGINDLELEDPYADE